MAIFQGTNDEFMEKINKLNLKYDIKENSQNKLCIKFTTGEIVNFWQNTGKYNFQGKDNKLLQEKIDHILSSNDTFISNANKQTNKKIFIVHGHDYTALEQLELLLRKVDLEPYILQKAGEISKTIIEALESKIIEESICGIVLLTPDDVGKNHNEEILKPRARQNVILEMGILIGALGREKTIILKKENVEIPSDLNGILYIQFNEHIKECGVAMLKHMKEKLNIEIDDKKLLDAL